MSKTQITVTDEDKDVSLEEIASDGHGSGLEAERTDESDIRKPFDPELIDVITQGQTVSLLLTRLKEEELDLSPDFQRRSNLWNNEAKSALIESMLLRIPIPSLYMSEANNGNFTVVDGLQRMCAIAHFVAVADLNKAVKTKLVPLRLEKLKSLVEYNDNTFEELPRTLQRRINETVLTLNIIRASTPQEVKFNIFSRINRGGLPLNAQEIRNAIYPGEWRKNVHDLSTNEAFKIATENKIKGERLEDLELILRFVALYDQQKTPRPADQNLDQFLNNFVESSCAKWVPSSWKSVEIAFIRAMKAAPKIFGKMAFRKYSPPNEARRPINRGLFETESVALAHLSEEQITKLEPLSKQVIDRFHHYFENDRDFENSLLSATGRGWASNKRFEIINKILMETLND